VVKKLLILLMVAGAVLAARPEWGERLIDGMSPSAAYSAVNPVFLIRPALDTVLGWSARREVQRIAREMRTRGLSGEPLPAPEQFQKYLQRQHLSGRAGMDPWGRPYYLIAGDRLLTIGSPGRDGVRGTSDDITTIIPR
jgi:hypothetical protein